LKTRTIYKGVMPPYRSILKNNFEVCDNALVDGEQWYTVQVMPCVQEWVKQQEKNFWYEHFTANNYKVVNTFDMHERLYTMLALRWS
jgi:hypothetical protein